MAHLLLSGNSGSYAFTLDAPVLGVTGDLDLIIDVERDFDGASSVDLIAKVVSAAERSFWFSLVSGASFRFQFWDSSDTSRLFGSSPHGLSGVQRQQLRAFLDVDNGTGGSTVYFSRRATSGDSWTAVGNHTVATTTGAIRTSTAFLGVGSRSGVNDNLDAKVFAAQMWSGDSTSGGTKVFDPDPSDPTTWTYS